MKWIFPNKKGNGRLFLWDVTYRPITSGIYVALESAYGQVPTITAANRIPLMKLGAKQIPVVTGRKDKTGSRTFVGLPEHDPQDDELSH